MRRRSAPRIFISYRREDTGPHAGRLYDRLSDRFGESLVFMDVGSIRPGADFAKTIIDAVASCDLLLAVIGPRWSALSDRGERRIAMPDDYVRIEIDAALRRDIGIIPILVDGAEMPSQDELPSDLQALAFRQGFRLSQHQFRTELAHLIEIIENTKVRKAGRPRPSSVADQFAPGFINWKVDSIVKESYTRQLVVSGRERHTIEFIVESVPNLPMTAELLKVDGQLFARSDRPYWRRNWRFSFEDGGEIVPAKITAYGSRLGSTIKVFELEIGGQLIYSG